MYSWARVPDLTPTGVTYFTRCLYSGWVTRSLLINARAATSSLHLCGQLTLEVADIRLEIVRGYHFDEKEVVIVLLELLTGGVL